MSRKISQDESNAYLDGWRDGHRGKDPHCGYLHGEKLRRAYRKGYVDSKHSRIDADWALGPDKLPDGAETEAP